MIIVNVRITIDPQKRDQYLKFIQNLVQKSLKDDGNLAYGHYQDTNDQDSYLILEHWDSRNNLEKHLKTKHLINFKNHINDYTVKNPELLFMTEKQ